MLTRLPSVSKNETIAAAFRGRPGGRENEGPAVRLLLQ
jgi:hypothetical protein